ncbi:hypothetical protein D3261_03465 [Halococcus sp. IIIV-5B]|nr:hypothetical protein D3261_03465 [Halococcus sp. IIIV-5B]
MGGYDDCREPRNGQRHGSRIRGNRVAGREHVGNDEHNRSANDRDNHGSDYQHRNRNTDKINCDGKHDDQRFDQHVE